MDLSSFYSELFKHLEHEDFKHWLPTLKQELQSFPIHERWGDAKEWFASLEALERFRNQLTDSNSRLNQYDPNSYDTSNYHPSSYDLNSHAINVKANPALSHAQREELQQHLMGLHPWRKGPFELFGLLIDTEWQSHKKWQRLEQAFDTLEGERILDIGAGNGYYGWRMLGKGADLVVGIDPTFKFVLQWQAIRTFLPKSLANFVLPIGVEQLPDQLKCFDRVFSMGVLYHRRSPFDHLYQLKNTLKPNGHLILETLIIDGKLGEVLVPDGRYAKMRNVWFIPSTDTLMQWLKRVGFSQIELVDVSPTTCEEQRRTEWMTFESLSDFLNDEQTMTIEGHPLPKRALVKAQLR